MITYIQLMYDILTNFLVNTVNGIFRWLNLDCVLQLDLLLEAASGVGR